MKKIKLFFIVLFSVFSISLIAQDEGGGEPVPQIIFDMNSLIELHEFALEGPCNGYLLDANFYLENLSQTDLDKILTLHIGFKIEIEGIDPEDLEPLDFSSWTSCIPSLTTSTMSVLKVHGTPNLYQITIHNPSLIGIPGQDGCYYIGSNSGDCPGPSPTTCSIVTVDLNKIGVGGQVDVLLTFDYVRMNVFSQGWQDLPPMFYNNGWAADSMICSAQGNNLISQPDNNTFFENEISLASQSNSDDFGNSNDINSFSEKLINRNNNDLKNIIVSPNPFNNNLNISLSQELSFCSISILNASGKLIMKKEISNPNELILDTSNYSKGVYFLKIVNNNKSFTKKVIKL